MPGLVIALQGLERNASDDAWLTPVLAQRGVRLGQNNFPMPPTSMNAWWVSKHYCFRTEVRRPAGQYAVLVTSM